jgi:hypothetical protein
MKNNIVFTRYLYEKDEVKKTFMISVLNKKTEEALFWSYELFYSGFVNELTDLFWIIYYDFYAIMNVSFEKYLSLKIKTLKDNNDEKMVAVIVKNFIIRESSVDGFFMRIIFNDVNPCKKFENSKKELDDLLEKQDFQEISKYVLQEIEDKNLIEILAASVMFFIKHGLKIDGPKFMKEFGTIMKKNGKHKRIILLTRIMHLFSLKSNIKQGKNIYEHVNPEEIVVYETINVDIEKKLSGYKILPLACMFKIDEDNYLSLFKLKRDDCDLLANYRDNWLYYASFSPLWNKRIQMCNGFIDDENKTVEFKDENMEELFYDKYNYEPDEQTLDVQYKSAQPILSIRDWSTFYNENKKNNLISLNEQIFIGLTKIDYYTDQKEK